MPTMVITKIPGIVIHTGAPEEGSPEWEDWNKKFYEPPCPVDNDNQDDEE